MHDRCLLCVCVLTDGFRLIPERIFIVQMSLAGQYLPQFVHLVVSQGLLCIVVAEHMQALTCMFAYGKHNQLVVER